MVFMDVSISVFLYSMLRGFKNYRRGLSDLFSSKAPSICPIPKQKYSVELSACGQILLLFKAPELHLEMYQSMSWGTLSLTQKIDKTNRPS